MGLSFGDFTYSSSLRSFTVRLTVIRSNLNRNYRQSKADTPSHPGGVSSDVKDRQHRRTDREKDKGVYASSKHRDKDRRDRDRDRDRRRDRNRDYDRSMPYNKVEFQLFLLDNKSSPRLFDWKHSNTKNILLYIIIQRMNEHVTMTP